MLDPTRRFSDRVENYVKYRPHYPAGVLETMREACGLAPDWVVADVGSGVGFLAELFLAHGNPVIGVEPNGPMREAGERYLSRFAHFHSVDGAAEATTLPAQSVDLVVAGQAAHWFDLPRARAEFARILRPPGWAALVWNTRLTHGSPFLAGYERLLRQYATEYEAVVHTEIGVEQFAAFFDTGSYQRATFPNQQQFDWEGLKGRLLSSSYTPLPSHSHHEPLLRGLRDLFERHAEGGRVAFLYETELHWGRLTPAS